MALTKILNDENKSFQPVLTDKLVYDTKPTVNSFNGITSDAVARAIAGASGEVPAVTESDNGKILTAIYDEGGAAVEWADAPSGIPDMAGQDGKILGAVDNGGTMEAQWISKPVSNVTTSDKQFVVGVNGTGKPITVNCANATEIGNTSTFTVNGSYTTYQNGPCAYFPLEHLDPCSLGTGTATLTIPEDITYDTSKMNLNTAYIFYWKETTGTPGPQCSISENILSTGKIKAGTYTISGANPDIGGNYNGITIYVMGGGFPDDWAAFLATFTEAIQSWTLSYSSIEVTGYSITPAVLPSGGSVNRFLTVDSYGKLIWGTVPNELPSITGNANGVLTVNKNERYVEWKAPLDYTMVYNTTPAGGSMDGTPWQAVQAGKRIGVVVPYSAFSGSLAAGSLYSSGKIYMPLASVVDRGSGEYRWNFYLYDGSNKWSLVLTCEEDEWSWGTPNVVAG